MQPTIKQVAEWIIQNRKKKAFYGYDYDKIVQEIVHSIAHRVFAVSHDEDGNIFGVVCGDKDEGKKAVHIYDILTVRSAIIKSFMAQFLLQYKGYSITATRREAIRVYNNPTKLHNLL